MMAIFGGAGPRVFATPPGADFAAALARGMMTRLGTAPPEALASVEIVLNTQRTRRAVSEAFEELGPAVFLPRLATIDGFAQAECDAPPPVDRLSRRLTLTRLVEARLRAAPGLGPIAAAGPLAEALAALLDETQREDVPLSALDGIVEGGMELAARWEETLAFLRVIRDLWPATLAADPARSDPEARRAAAMAALLRRWQSVPPTHPLIVAGSTGSQKISVDLLVAVASLPQGAIILPGFDWGMDADAWAAVTPDHPQYGFSRLMRRLGIGPGEVGEWTQTPPNPRARLLTEALRPAPVTHKWRAALPELTRMGAVATAGLTLIEAPSPRREAEAIALVMREALERGERRIALITPDRPLARRVAAILDRWGLEPDDSSGRPLALTPPGVFLIMLAPFLTGAFDASAFLALLKHPLFCADARRAHLKAVERLELGYLRKRQEALRLRSVAAIEGVIADELVADADSPLAHLLPALACLRPWSEVDRPLADMVADHVSTASALGGSEVWAKKAGREAAIAMDRLREAAPSYGDAAPGLYPTLLAAALSDAPDLREEAYRADQRLKIWGPLEARSQSADTVILGGLNEGVWPPAPAVDPWLSRPMRVRAGLQPPEQRIGLSAHDFVQAASAPRAVLTRAVKQDGATIRARWLARLMTLLEGVDEGRALSAMRARGQHWLSLADAMGAVDAPKPAPRPAPRPPAAARPRELWVTDIEQLIRDPYSVYAKRVLKLRPLDDAGAVPDVRLRGQVLHAVVETFIKETREEVPPGRLADDLFMRIAEAEIGKVAAAPALAAAWAARLDRVRDWFLFEERKRRAHGCPVGVEATGAVTFTTDLGPFKLGGRADRIDRLRRGGVAIYDYKAADTPSPKQVALFAKQLPLLAAISAAGGFEGLPPEVAAELAYLSLSGAGEGGKMTTISPEEDVLTKLAGLISRFEDEDTAYIPRAYPEQITYASDYDHLSRYGEWTDRPADDAPIGEGEG
ncbi:MAG: double-strand break repair protein AddB [Pseudomonadota bacterium]